MTSNSNLTAPGDSTISSILFIIALSTAAVHIFSGYPFIYLFNETAQLRSVFRILFALIFLLSLIRTRDALPILFGYSLLQNKTWRVLSIYYIQIILAIFLVFGIFTDGIALLLLIFRTSFNEMSKRFGLENTVYQIVLVHLPFIGSGSHLSVDALFGIPSFLSSPVMFNSLFVLTAIMFFPGFYHKLKSEFWREGRAVKKFLILPQIRGKPFRGWKIPLNENISTLMSYTMVFAQFSLLFSSISKYFLLTTTIIFIGFSISLFTVVDLSFIGQVVFCVIFMYTAAVVLNFASYPPFALIFDFSITPATPFSLTIITLATLTTLKFNIVADTPLRTASRILSGQNATVMPFNEQHTSGIYVFRLIYENTETGKKKPVLEVYDKKGWQKQFFYPRYYEVSTLVLADYCLSVQEKTSIRSAKREDIIDLCASGLYSIGETSGKIHLNVKIFENSLDGYRNKNWEEIGVCTFKNGEPEWELLNPPPKYENHPRLNFDDSLKTGR